MHSAIQSDFIQPVHAAIFDIRSSPIKVDETSNPLVISAAKTGLVDLYLLLPPGPVAVSPGSTPQVASLAAHLVGASLFYEVQESGVGAVEKLSRLADRGLPLNLNRVARNSVVDLLKCKTDRGTREKTEKLLDSDVTASAFIHITQIVRLDSRSRKHLSRSILFLFALYMEHAYLPIESVCDRSYPNS